MKGEKSKSGVFKFYNFRDNLIIDKYDPVFLTMRGNKTNQMRSENSEDALTWNVFKSLQKISPEIWYPYLIMQGLNKNNRPYHFEHPLEYIEVPKMLQIKLWQPIDPPPSLRYYQKDEGQTEVDIILESEDFVWFIEAKYKSDISYRTTNNENRNQILRNIDVGTWYAGVRDFYFSLLILDEKYSSTGAFLVDQYNHEMERSKESFLEYFEHRNDGLKNLKDISLIYWNEVASIIKYSSKYNEDEFERTIALRAFNWLKSKKIIENRDWWDEDLSKKYKNYPKPLEYILKVQQFAEYGGDYNKMKYFLPKGYDELGFPTKSTLENYDNITSYYDDYELGYNQFNENGLPWWWRKDNDVEGFYLKFFEVLGECEALGYIDEEEFWNKFDSNPEETLGLTYFLLALWYLERER